jgi:hypothetical protein
VSPEEYPLVPAMEAFDSLARLLECTAEQQEPVGGSSSHGPAPGGQFRLAACLVRNLASRLPDNESVPA